MTEHESGRGIGAVRIIADVMPEPEPLAGAAGVPPRRAFTGIGSMDFGGSEPPPDVDYGPIPEFVPDLPVADPVPLEVRQRRRRAAVLDVFRRIPHAPFWMQGQNRDAER